MFIRTQSNRTIYNTKDILKFTKHNEILQGNYCVSIWTDINTRIDLCIYDNKEDRDEAWNVLCEGLAKGATMVDYYRGEVDDKN